MWGLGGNKNIAKIQGNKNYMVIGITGKLEFGNCNFPGNYVYGSYIHTQNDHIFNFFYFQRFKLGLNVDNKSDFSKSFEIQSFTSFYFLVVSEARNKTNRVK